jgi:hypothetical protein
LLLSYPEVDVYSFFLQSIPCFGRIFYVRGPAP